MTSSLYRCPCCGQLFRGKDIQSGGYIVIPAKCPKCGNYAKPVFGTMLKDKIDI